jgi:hypothetical protein
MVCASRRTLADSTPRVSGEPVLDPSTVTAKSRSPQASQHADHGRCGQASALHDKVAEISPAQQARSNSALRGHTSHHAPAVLRWWNALLREGLWWRSWWGSLDGMQGSGVQIPSAPPPQHRRSQACPSFSGASCRCLIARFVPPACHSVLAAESLAEPLQPRPAHPMRPRWRRPGRPSRAVAQRGSRGGMPHPTRPRRSHPT